MDKIQSISRSAGITAMVDQLRYNIITRNYDQKKKMLPEKDLSEEFGVSRGSVRTALQVLENEGLVGTLPNGRKFIVGISEKDVNDYYEIRSMLECAAARIILRMDYVDYSDLAIAVNELHEIADEPDETVLRNRRVEANTKFHRIIIHMSRNRALIQCWKTIEPVLITLAKINSDVLDKMSHQHDYIELHTKILEMIITKDEALIDYLNNHISVEAKNATYKGIRKIGGDET
jgi:DNA-binding GntR family transcriptional regulator